MKARALLASLLFLAADPAAAQSWEQLVDASVEYLEAQQKKMVAEYDLSKHEEWNMDSDSGELVFSTKGAPAVVAKFQEIGTVSKVSNTWLWSWANSSVPAGVTVAARTVRQHGQKNGFRKLTERKWDAGEADGWEMAAVSAYLLKAKGAYRAPYDNGAAFLIVTEIRWVK
jgi:hypothetical protein